MPVIASSLPRLFFITAMMLAMLSMFAAAGAEEPWRRHTIDDSSRGADGVRLADANGDGLLDIATGWEQGGVVRVYLHPGQARVRQSWPAVTVGRVGSPEDALLADLDGDGRLDVVSCSEGKTKAVHFHFAAAQAEDYLEASQWTTEVVPCTAGRQMFMFALPLDIDGRNGIDLIVGSKGDNAAIGWLEGPANARDVAAWKWHPLREAGWIMSLEAEDMDRDGDLDVLFTDRKQSRRGIFWLENPGASATRAGDSWREHALGGQDVEVMFLARTKTDAIDTVACAVSGGPLLVLRNGGRNSDKWSIEEIPLPPGSGTGKAAGLGDLDGDGDLDLAYTCERANGELAGVGWLEAIMETRKLRWRPHPISGAPGVKFDRLELLDLDGDKDLDLLTCEEADNLGVIWYENPSR